MQAVLIALAGHFQEQAAQLGLAVFLPAPVGQGFEVLALLRYALGLGVHGTSSGYFALPVPVPPFEAPSGAFAVSAPVSALPSMVPNISGGPYTSSF